MDTSLQQLKDSNIYPDIVDYDGAKNSFSGEPESYNLLPDTEKPATNRMTQVVFWLTGLVLLMLITAVLVYPVWQMAETGDYLRSQLTEIEKDSHIVQAQQLENDSIVDETARLIKSKNNSPSLTDLINTLSQLIPDNTWLTHFKYNDDRLQIQGQSPSASVLISILEASPLFSNARFVSPLTQDKKTGLERFQISMDVLGQGEKTDD